MTTLKESITILGEEREYAQEKLLMDVTEEIIYEMARLEVSKAELAEKLGKSKSFVTRLLSGDHNMTLRTLSDICFALSLAPQIYIDGESHARSHEQWQRVAVNAVEMVSKQVEGLTKKLRILSAVSNEPDTVAKEGWLASNEEMLIGARIQEVNKRRVV